MLFHIVNFLKCYATKTLFSIVAYETLTFHKFVCKDTFEVLRDILKCFFDFNSENFFENWSIFDQVIRRRIKCQFLGHTVEET